MHEEHLSSPGDVWVKAETDTRPRLLAFSVRPRPSKVSPDRDKTEPYVSRQTWGREIKTETDPYDSKLCYDNALSHCPAYSNALLITVCICGAVRQTARVRWSMQCWGAEFCRVALVTRRTVFFRWKVVRAARLTLSLRQCQMNDEVYRFTFSLFLLYFYYH